MGQAEERIKDYMDNLDQNYAEHYNNENLPEDESCLWKVYDEETNPYWESECGSMFQFNNGDWQANHFTFCPYCGKKIRDE